MTTDTYVEEKEQQMLCCICGERAGVYQMNAGPYSGFVCRPCADSIFTDDTGWREQYDN